MVLIDIHELVNIDRFIIPYSQDDTQGRCKQGCGTREWVCNVGGGKALATP